MIEDDPDDRELTRSSIKELGFDVEIKFAKNGKEAFELLEVNPGAQLILIDYNITPEDGLQVMKEIKQVKEFQSIPVIILTDNTDKELIRSGYLFGASSIVKKPLSDEATKQKIDTFFNYWLKVAEL
jgi:CheY-like chemotaxis protein